MTKMIKLSLAAAVAVSALSTTATAGSLEDSIKDTTISGKILVGYNYADDKATNAKTNQAEYDIDLTLNTKVNDMITAQVGFEADNTTVVRSDEDAATTETTDTADVRLTKLNFTAKTDVATVIVGKQKQPTPFFDDERGDGVVALIPAGPVTIAAGHFTGLNSSIDFANNGTTATGAGAVDLMTEQRDVSALAVIGSVGPVNASLWYATLSGAQGFALPAVEDGAKAYSLNLNGKFDIVNVDFTHSAAELANEGASDWNKETLTKLIVSAKVADVNLVAGYGMTNDNKNDARNHGVDLTGDNDAKTNFRLDQIVLDKYNDADALLLGASMTFGATTVGANYLMATINGQDGAVDTDGTELDLTVKYAMSKNFSITGLYADTEIKSDGVKSQDSTHMELSLNYKF